MSTNQKVEDIGSQVWWGGWGSGGNIGGADVDPRQPIPSDQRSYMPNRLIMFHSLTSSAQLSQR